MRYNSRNVLIAVIVMALFSVLAMVIPFTHTPTFWVGYGFGMFALLFYLLVFGFSFADGSDAKSMFYGFPIARIGMLYLIVQLVVSAVEMLLARPLTVWVPVLVNTVILAVALIGCINADAMRSEIKRQDARLKDAVANMRELQSLSRTLVDQCQDAALRPTLEKLADEFRFSDPVSSDNTSALEVEMRGQLGAIQQALVDGDSDGAKKLCGKLMDCLMERNRICSVSK